ncbi:MAG TPA: hypothetical protein VLM05_02190 [Mycobacteriales bacterium]|nr:hypothetical protein [Mycobacteriales bacterium]
MGEKRPRRKDAEAAWFQRRPGVTVGIAALLYAGVSGLAWAVEDPQPITMLFCFPIALLAVAFGLRAGLQAGTVGILLAAAFVATNEGSVSFWGWLTQAVPMLLLGGLLGDAADRLRRSEQARVELWASAQRQRDAVELQDSVLQQIAVAKWALESGHADRGLEIVTATLEATQGLVSDMLRDVDADPAHRRA